MQCLRAEDIMPSGKWYKSLRSNALWASKIYLYNSIILCRNGRSAPSKLEQKKKGRDRTEYRLNRVEFRLHSDEDQAVDEQTEGVDDQTEDENADNRMEAPRVPRSWWKPR